MIRNIAITINCEVKMTKASRVEFTGMVVSEREFNVPPRTRSYGDGTSV